MTPPSMSTRPPCPASTPTPPRDTTGPRQQRTDRKQTDPPTGRSGKRPKSTARLARAVGHRPPTLRPALTSPIRSERPTSGRLISAKPAPDHGRRSGCIDVAQPGRPRQACRGRTDAAGKSRALSGDTEWVDALDEDGGRTNKLSLLRLLLTGND